MRTERSAVGVVMMRGEEGEGGGLTELERESVSCYLGVISGRHD